MIEVNIQDECGNHVCQFPRLMRLRESPCVIVHFENERCGYQLTGDPGGTRFWASWDMSEFEDFTGTLQLRNHQQGASNDHDTD